MPEFVPDTDDVMIDVDREDELNAGKITEVKKFTVLRLNQKHGLDAAEISQQLKLNRVEVEQALAEFQKQSPIFR
ncbi:hypothetical protein [Agrobacterium genomosp. 13]|uniref:hypothetical protein n=1 Tax=Agrobacterium genomosp. 13 TaxID=1183419 RepID=UPI0009BBE27A|nr:hypothetical protein [Agrobacterium genomosp. 13]